MAALIQLFESTLSNVITPKCYRKIFHDYTIDRGCVETVISKGLGYGIVFGASIVKVPQLLKVYRAKSTEGLSFLSVLLETASYANALVYNVRKGYPYSTYGETLFISAQNAVLLCFLAHYPRNSTVLPLLVMVGLGAAGYALQTATMDQLAFLQQLGIPLILFSRLPQIWANWRNGHTGQLSAFAVFLFLAGSVARVFTTFKEVKDPVLLAGTTLGAVLNAIIALQMIMYWNAKKLKKA